MKKNSILKVSLLTILLIVLCTWIFKTISFDGTALNVSDKSELGLFTLLSYITDIFRYFPYVPITVLSIGIFYGVAYKIPAYRALPDAIVRKFEGKENIFVVVVMVVTAVLVSLTGLSLGMLFIFPFIISIVLLMGYNKLVAASVTVGSTMVGLIGTTLGISTTNYINYVLGINYDTEMITKVILLVVGLVILCVNVVLYANKTKNATDKVLDCVPDEGKKEKVSAKKVEEVVVAEKVEEKKETKTAKKTAKKKATKKSSKTRANDNASSSVKVVKHGENPSTLPFIIVFDLVFILLVVGTFNWTGVFKATWPADVLKAIKEFTIGGFPIFQKLLFGSAFTEFGSWSVNLEVPIVIFTASLVMALIYGLSLEKLLDGMVEGVKKAIKPAIYMTLIYLVLVVVVYHPFQLHITKFFMTASKGLNVVTMSAVAFFASLLNIECPYVAQGTLPYVMTVITDKSLYPIIGVIYQSIYGLTMLIAPTSVILLGTLSYLDVSYVQWVKHIWKVVLELLVALLVVFLVLVLI